LGLKHLKTLSRWVLKHRELEQHNRQILLVEQRLQLDRDEWEYDIARQVLLHHAEFDQLRRESSTTDEEKINLARAALFNRKPEDLPAIRI